MEKVRYYGVQLGKSFPFLVIMYGGKCFFPDKLVVGEIKACKLYFIIDIKSIHVTTACV